MKILESIPIINDNKVVFGDKELRLALETETGRIAINTPAMFTDPVVRLDELQEKLEKLKAHMEREESAE